MRRYRAIEPVMYAASGPARRYEPGEELEMLEAHALACPPGTVEAVAGTMEERVTAKQEKPKGK